MRVRAPGKLLLTGAYAVLEGAPAVVMAVNRYAVAQHPRNEPQTSADRREDRSVATSSHCPCSGDRSATTTPAAAFPALPSSLRPEVMEAARRLGAEVPHLDVSSLEHAGRKLGLGGSAASVAAAAGFVLASRGGDLNDLDTRRRVFDVAFDAHLAVQPRGSGADVAASVWGGVSIVTRAPSDTLPNRPSVERTRLPAGLYVDAWAYPLSVRTSDLLERWSERGPAVASAMSVLRQAAVDGAAACRQGNLAKFLTSVALHVEGLHLLGLGLDASLVPPELSHVTVRSPTVLLPSGAGGGDIILRISDHPAQDSESAALRSLGLLAIDLALDDDGVASYIA